MPRPYLSLMLPNLVQEGMPILDIDTSKRPFARGWVVRVDPDLDLRERPRISVVMHLSEFKTEYYAGSHPCHYALDTSTESGQRFAACWYLTLAPGSSTEPFWLRQVFSDLPLTSDDLGDMYDDCMALAVSMGYVAEAWHDRSI